MAVITSVAEIAGTKNIPAPNEVGKVYEYDVVVDTSSINLASGDFLQLCVLPPEVVVTELAIVASGTTTATFDLGIADAEATTAITSLYDPGTLSTTSEGAKIFGDTKSSVNRILAAEIGVAAESTVTVTVRVQYRAG